jgi:hypothetical protein
MKTAAVLLIAFLAAIAATGQEFPDRVDGYKVHRVAKKTKDFSLTLSKPAVTGADLSQIKFEVEATVTAKVTASVERILLEDLTVNGIAVKASPYAVPFEIKKGKAVTLPEKLQASVKSSDAAKAAWREIADRKKDWHIKGRAVIFGKFRRFGMTWTRAVPVEIDLFVKNPVPEAVAVIFDAAGLK